MLVGDGRFPREIPISAAVQIGAAVAPPSKFSALFLTSDIPLIVSLVRELRPAIVHVGASAELLSSRDGPGMQTPGLFRSASPSAERMGGGGNTLGRGCYLDRTAEVPPVRSSAIWP